MKSATQLDDEEADIYYVAKQTAITVKPGCGAYRHPGP